MDRIYGIVVFIHKRYLCVVMRVYICCFDLFLSIRLCSFYAYTIYTILIFICFPMQFSYLFQVVVALELLYTTGSVHKYIFPVMCQFGHKVQRQLISMLSYMKSFDSNIVVCFETRNTCLYLPFPKKNRMNSCCGHSPTSYWQETDAFHTQHLYILWSHTSIKNSNNLLHYLCLQLCSLIQHANNKQEMCWYCCRSRFSIVSRA